MRNFTIFSVLIIILTFTRFGVYANTTGDESKADTIGIPHIGIHLNITNISGKQINGYADLSIKALVNNVKTVNLDLYKLTVDSVFINNLKSLSFIYKSPNILLQISLSATINTGDTLNLKIYYHGSPTGTATTGGWQFTNSTYAYNVGCDLSLVPHAVGRVWFPCIDDHRTRSTFDYYITTDTTHNAVCGGILVSTTNNDNGTRTYHWNLSNSIPSYISSVDVAKYVTTSDTLNAMLGVLPLKYNFVTSDVSLETQQTYFANLHKIFHFWEKSFGPYRWQKVGYTGTTFSIGSMEHATNIMLPNLVTSFVSAYEYIEAHELSHHWFGDLITCATEGDMWLNEGFAQFCQIYYEEGIYSKAKYKTDMRTNHFDDLLATATIDKGSIPIYNVPSSLTYGATVYFKGSNAVHSLRGYLGDNRFFSTIKKYTAQNQFNSMSTPEFANFWSANSGMDIHDFIKAWIYSPGYLHFSVDSFKVTPQDSKYNVEVFARQRLLNATTYADSNRLEITFMKNDWETYTDTLTFSGHYGDQVFTVPFQPDLVIIDKEEKIADATTDNYQTIKTTGTVTFPNTFFSLKTSQVTDSAFVRAERSWIHPDYFKKKIGYKVSTTGYWKIDGIFPEGFNSVGVFAYTNYATNTYNNESYEVDKPFLPTATSYDSLVLLYRANTKADWQIVPSTTSGDNISGTLTTTNPLIPGEYTLGKPGTDPNSIKNYESEVSNFNIYPNPSSSDFHIEYNVKQAGIIKVFNLQGGVIETINIPGGQNTVDWNPTNAKQGTYIIGLFTLDNQYISSKIVAIIK